MPEKAHIAGNRQQKGLSLWLQGEALTIPTQPLQSNAPLALDALPANPYIISQEQIEVDMNQAQKPLEGAPLIAPSSTDHDLYDAVVEACRTVYDPEIPVNIYELGLIYTIDINDENEVRIKMSLTAPGCPVAGEMPGWVAEAIEPLAGVKTVDVELVWEPPWGMEMMSDEARLELGFM